MSKLRQKQRKEKRKQKAKKNALRRNLTDWSIATHPHDLPSKNGKVRLYHFTVSENLPGILRYGVIKGDVCGPDILVGQNWNAPNLTKENRLHNPMNTPVFNTEPVIRLEVYFDENDENIINMGWFDRRYCKRQNKNLIDDLNAEGSMNGNINDHYIYRGWIKPEQIKKISVWNPETRYWDRFSKSQKIDAENLNSDLSMTCSRRTHLAYDWLRMCGLGQGVYDLTGHLQKYYEMTDETEVLSPLYAKTDKIGATLKGKELRNYRIFLKHLITDVYDIRYHLTFIAETYNKYVAKECDADWFEQVVGRINTWTDEVSKNRSDGELVVYS